MSDKILKESTEKGWCVKKKINTLKKSIRQLFTKQRKRALALMLALFTFCSAMTPAISSLALTVGSSYSITKTYVSGVEYDYNKSGLTDQYGNTSYRHGQFNVLKVSSSNEIVYCLEPFIDIETTSGLKGMDFEDTNAWLSLSLNQHGLIALATMYGCVGTDTGNNYLPERTATQIIIWDIVFGERTDYSGKTTKPRWITSWTPDVQKAHSDILTDMETHSKYPKFNKTNITLKGVGNAQTITDTNGVLSEYEVASNSDLNLSISGNNLVISAKKAGNYSSTITLNKKKLTGPTSSPLALRCGNEQTVLYGKVYDPMSVNISVKVEAGTANVNVEKVAANENVKIAGATISVWQYSKADNDYHWYNTLEWNASSKSYKSTKELQYTDDNAGYFYVWEAKAPSGYVAAGLYDYDKFFDTATMKQLDEVQGKGRNAGIFRISADQSDQNISITIKEEPITAKLKFRKQYEDANGNRHTIKDPTILNSLNFEIQEWDNAKQIYKTYDAAQFEIDQDDDYTTVTGLKYSSSNLGWFRLVENADGTAKPIGVVADMDSAVYEYPNPNSYLLSNTKGVFNIAQSKTGEFRTDNLTYWVTIVDDVQYGDLIVQKTSEDSFVEGMKFLLEGTSDLGEEISYTATTDKNGIAKDWYDADNNLINGIQTGDYTITEIEYPDWYTPQFPNGLNVSIDENGGEPIKVYFNNDLKKGNIKITKDSEDGFVLGREFRLTGTAFNGTKLDITKAIETVNSNGKGIVEFNDILLGDNYKIEEVNVPDRYIQPNALDGQTVKWNETLNLSFKNDLKRGDLVVIKSAEDGEREGFKFRLHGTSDSGIKVDETLTTNTEGWVVFNNILIGDYVLEEVETPIKYVQPASQNVRIDWNEKTELWAGKDEFNTDKHTVAHFENTLKKFRVEITKLDSEKTLAQGNATLEGAEYGIYKSGKLIDTYTTDAEGKIVTDYYICDDDWTVKEITPSEGYLLDETVYEVGIEPNHYEIELNNAPVIKSYEDVIKGDFEIIKHSDNGETQIETPEVGATFEIYLKSAGSYENANPDERDILVCDENGFAQTKLLPYGSYTVHQTKGAFEAEFMPDFDVFIKNDGETKHFLINNKPFESHIKVEKKDAETHKKIAYAGAGFQIYDPDGNLVTMKYTYPTLTFVDTFYTDGNGEFTTPEKLPAGKGYTLVEVEAPYGYILDSTPVEFDVIRDNSESDFDDQIIVIKLNKYDVAQKGILTIYKEGEVFSSVEENNGVFKPVFANKYLANAVYEIYAAEDIITGDGTVRYSAGDLVDTVNTDKNGIAKSKELYLGKYKVVEKTAPDSFTVDTNEYEVEFTYQGQEIEITRKDMNLFDKRQKVEISLNKVLEQNETYNTGNNNEILNVEFGVFANEDIEAEDGTVIPKYGLICSAHCDENGNIIFPCDLPIGYKYYVQEISTDEHYQLDDTKYKFNTKYAGQDIDVIHIDINNGEPIENTLIAGNIEITKSNEEGKLIEGVKFGIFANDCKEFTEKNALFIGLTNEKGKLIFDNVPYGDYKIVELEAAKNYIPNTKPISVSNKTGGEVIKIDVENTEVKGIISVTKEGEVFYSVTDNEDSTKNFIYKTENLKDAEFDIIAAEDIYSYERSEGVLWHKEGEVVQTLKTDENGLAKSDELYLGKYKVVEKTAPDGFKINSNVFEISLDFDNRTEDIVYSDLTVNNTRQRAAISLVKEMEKDEIFGLGDKNEIENVVFGLFSNEEMTAYDGTVIPKDTILSMAKTDKEGYLEFDIDIPYCYKYYVQEIATDNHYSLSNEKFKFDFSTKDRDILGLEFKINDGKVIVNYLKRGTIDINKFGEINASDNTIPLSDTVFGLFYTDCTEFTEENAILTVTTNENGYAKFEFVDYGEYLIKEIQSHEGYVVSDEIFTVNIGEDAQNEVINVLNNIIRGNVTVQKVDADFTDRNLEGAVFNLYTDVDNNGVYDEDIDTLYGVLNDLSDGLYEIADVPYGHYLLHEETAPHGFVADENYYPVFVCEDGATYDLTNNDEFFINNAETGELKIIKTSSDGIVEGFEFLIEGISEAGTEISITAKTDKDGIIHIPVIRTGTYTISEINLDERYVVPKPQEITITNGETVEVKFFNKVITGTIEITKTDVVTGDTLPNTLIEILDKDGNVIRSGETDENGVITFEELPYGTYFYKESKAPKGYLIDETPHEFSITEDGQIIKAVMTNQLIETTPNTGTSIVYVAGATVALSAVLGILLIIYKRKKGTVTE